MSLLANSEPIKVCICIATCRRIPYLKILLTKLSEITVPDNVTLQVVVADNDAAESARELVTTTANGYRYSLTYGAEKQRGIPFTRNKAVSLADKDSTFIAFIDDDEYPDEKWMYKLLEIQQQTNADLIQGPSLPEFVDNPPQWIIKGGFFLFSYFKLKTGADFPHYSVATNNLLVRYSMLMKLDGPFDESMGLIGCDDNALGIMLNKLGCKMIYTSEAITHEFVPESRTNVKWLLQRAYRSANTNWLLTQEKNIVNLLKLVVGAIARIVIGAVLFLPALILSPFIGLQYVVKMLRLIVRGVAIIAGIFGKNYEEYKHAYTVPVVNTQS